MIPAILTCVFVLYLYHSLNAPKNDGSTARAPGTSASDLARRLEELEHRLQALASNKTSGESKQ